MKTFDHVKGTSEFVYMIDNTLIYKTTDTGFEFPVPVEDLGGSHLNATEKSILLMKWIRKHLETLGEEPGSGYKTKPELLVEKKKPNPGWDMGAGLHEE